MLARARASVTAQTFRDFVWVIVNNGGDPLPVEREALAARAAGLAVILLNETVPAGIETAANRGVRASQSRYIAVHDDDDTWEPDFLAATVGALDSRSSFVGVICHTATVFEEIENERMVRLDRRPQNRWLKAIHLADLAIGNLFPPISFVYRRETYDAVAGYDESFPVLGDWAFNLSIAFVGDIFVVPKMLANYHVRVGAGSANDYKNSTIEKHWSEDAAFRNRMLRADFAANRVGLGWMLMSARLQNQYRRIAPFTPRRVPRIGNRTMAAVSRFFLRTKGRKTLGLKA